ncbi:hypothetical protein KEM52_004577, partial [Ascosphaera acerosa]
HLCGRRAAARRRPHVRGRGLLHRSADGAGGPLCRPSRRRWAGRGEAPEALRVHAYRLLSEALEEGHLHAPGDTAPQPRRALHLRLSLPPPARRPRDRQLLRLLVQRPRARALRRDHPRARASGQARLQ